MKRRILAMTLAISMVLSLGTVSAATLVTEDQVEQTIKALGIMEGDQNGNINWEGNITRAEFTKMLLVASPIHEQITSTATGYSLYRDVKANHWASGYIKLAVENQYLIGYTDGTFRPDTNITIEQAYTAVMKMLGYDVTAFTGVYPAAQMNKAAEIGLGDHLSVSTGTPITRTQCAQLFYNLMEVETPTGYYGTTIDCPIKDGEVDYLALIQDSLEGPYVATATTDLGFIPTAIYVDGVPQAATLVPGQVYYYNDFLQTLWIYTETKTGTLTARAPSSVSPTSLTVGGETYLLGTSAASYQASSLQGVEIGDTLTLRLGLDDVVVAVSPDEMADGLDFDLLTPQNLKGPYLWKDDDNKIDFVPRFVTANGEASSLDALEENDVYYYNELAKMVWVHTETVTGNVDDLLPNALTPTSIVLSGVTYALSSNDAKYLLSALNNIQEDDCVTLLLGLDGTVAGVVENTTQTGLYYGVVKGYNQTLSEKNPAIRTTLTMTATDGETYSFNLEDDKTWSVGDLVTVQVNQTGITATKQNTKSISGTVNTKATALENYTFADGINIIDTDDSGAVVEVKPARLAGVKLTDRNVRFYALNADGEITHLILDEVTGDTFTYGYVYSSTVMDAGMSLASSYAYVSGGMNRNLGGNGVAYNIDNGGVAIGYESDGSVDFVKQLSKTTLTQLSTTTALGDQKEFPVSSDVEVYLRIDSTTYTLVDLEKLGDPDAYYLTGWYDNLNAPAGGQIRIVTAKLK